MNQNHFEHNSNYSGFDQPPQHFINHQEDLNQQGITDVHDRWDKLEESHNELLNTIQSFCEKFLQQKQAASIDQSPLQERSIQEMEDLKQHYLDEIMSIEINIKKELQHLEQVANLSTYPSQHFKSFCYDDDDDYDYEESTIHLNEIFSQIPPSIAITPVLPTLEPEDSLIMGNEELSTIPEKESDEFIKSNVEDLVPIPSESDDTSESDSDCDLPSCDDFSPINIYEEKSVTFSNPLFDSNDDCTSSDDESLFDEDVPKDKNIESKDYYVSNLDEPDLLVTPLSDANEDECFDPGGNIDKIDAFLDIVVSTDIVDNYYNSKGDIIYLESLLIKDTTPNLPPEVFLDHDPRSLKDKLDKEDLKSMVKVFDPDIHKKFFSPTYVSLPFEDHHYLFFTYIIRNFLPYFTYLVNSSLPLSSGSEDIIFDPDISAFHFSSLEPVAYEYPMEVCSSTCSVSNITMIWGEST
ncbi:hypothetical protein Tco_1230385 [Tanacetum coccineum]